MSEFLNKHIDILCPACGAFYFEHRSSCPEVALLDYMQEEYWIHCPLPFCDGWLELNTQYYYECHKCSSQFVEFYAPEETLGIITYHVIINRRPRFDTTFRGDFETGMVVQMLEEDGRGSFLFDEICEEIDYEAQRQRTRFITFDE
jgi:uncharacterized OB-fold protein